MADPVAHSPIGHLAPPSAGPADDDIALAERAFVGKIGLRGDAGDPAFVAAVAAALGTAPPSTPNTVARGAQATLLWLGPDEWLAVLPPGAETDAIHRLDDAFAGRHASALDISDARTVIRLTGRRAADLLAKGCALDLHPRVFGPDTCAQSSIAKANVLIHRLDDGTGFDLYVAASFAEYLWTWLVDAAREYDAGPA